MNESWTQHRANKDKKCANSFCEKIIKKGEYYWKHYGRPYPNCQVCAREKMNRSVKRWEAKQKEKKEVTPEKMAERVLYDCTVNKVDPHQLMIALQNLMDLS